MAMKLKDALTAAPRGLLRLFSTSSTPSFFSLPTDTSARDQGEPNTNLFVSGLNKQTTTEGLKKAFSKFGEVVHAKVVTDKQHGYSKGFGFVKYATLEDAAKGIQGMDGKFLEGWVIFAEYAKPRPSPAAPDSTSATTYNSNSSTPSYRNSVSSYWHSMDKDTMNTSAAYGNSTSPTYGNNAHHSNNGPTYGNNDIGSVNQNIRDSGYGSNTEPVYRSNAVSGYGSNMNSAFRSNPGHSYGSNANGSATDVTHGNASNSVPMYEDVPQGDSPDPNGNRRSSAYGDEVAAGRY